LTYQTFRPRLGKLPKTAAKPALSAAYVNNFRQSEEIQVSPRKRDFPLKFSINDFQAWRSLIGLLNFVCLVVRPKMVN
jgi:hypothetical protein